MSRPGERSVRASPTSPPTNGGPPRGGASIPGGSLLEDVRFGLRVLVKNPGFTAVAVLTLAVGIGATTAIFSVVDAVLFRPFPYAEPERIVRLWERTPPPRSSMFALSPANFLDWRAQCTVFEDMAAIKTARPILIGVGEPERVEGMRVSASFFRILGVDTALGRTFTDDEDRLDGERVVVLSHGAWRRRFGADADIIGRNITLGEEPHTVIGVMPEGFNLILSFWDPEKVELWLPYPFMSDPPQERRAKRLSAIARLRPEVTLDQARAEIDTITRRLEEQYPESNTGWRGIVNPYHSDLVGYVRSYLLLLLGAVSFVLLIACANVANLLLARSVTREREVAVRAALGAGRRRLLQQLLVENVLLALAGGAAGVLLARWGVSTIVATSPTAIPRLDEVGVDTRVLGFTLLVCLVTSVVFGLVPALRGSRSDLVESLKDGVTTAITSGRHRGRSLLVAVEIALALILLAGGALLIDTFRRVQNIDIGIESDDVMTMQLSLPRERYAEATGTGSTPTTANFTLWTVGVQHGQLVSGVLDRLARVPGTESVAAVNFLPLGGTGWGTLLFIEGRQVGEPWPDAPRYTVNDEGQPHAASLRAVEGDYFSTMGIPLLRGREFTERDGASSPGVAIVSDAMAREYWPGEDPIGKRFLAQDGQVDEQRSFEIIGVVGDARQVGFEEWDMGRAAGPVMYIPYGQQATAYVDWQISFRMRVSFVARNAGDPSAVALAMRSAVWELDENQPIASIASMEERLSDSLKGRRFNAVLMGSFSVIALVLGMMGIYGVTAYSVGQRTHEIGLRMALGAQPGTVMRMVVWQGLVLTIVGIAVGIGGSYALTGLIARWLYGVGPHDPLVLVGVSLLMSLVALAACLVPARRAARVDPMIALRNE